MTACTENPYRNVFFDVQLLALRLELMRWRSLGCRPRLGLGLGLGLLSL